MAHGLDARSIPLYHDAFLQVAGGAAGAPDAGGGAGNAVAANHQFNCLLWREEDKVRRQDVPSGEIAEGKRRIDARNQQRNDEAGDGRAYFQVYRQCKMYHDPAPNPCLYRAGRSIPGR